MNPIGHSTNPSNNKMVNSRTGNYGKKLGTSNNIFVKDDPNSANFLGDSPAKKTAKFNEF